MVSDLDSLDFPGWTSHGNGVFSAEPSGERQLHPNVAQHLVLDRYDHLWGREWRDAKNKERFVWGMKALKVLVDVGGFIPESQFSRLRAAVEDADQADRTTYVSSTVWNTDPGSMVVTQGPGGWVSYGGASFAEPNSSGWGPFGTAEARPPLGVSRPLPGADEGDGEEGSLLGE